MNGLQKLAYIPYVAYRQAKWMAGDRSPFGATLKLTARCTLKCRHCPWLDSDIPDLPGTAWKEIIRRMRELGARHLVLEGGEPTLREDLEDLIAYARSLKMFITLATNCTRPLDRYSPDRFLISIDGLEPAHDSLRGKGAFSRLVENLGTARAPRIALVSLSRENMGEIEGVLEFFTPRLEGFWFSFVYDYGSTEGLSLSREEKRRAAQRIMELGRSYPVINKPSYLRRVGTPRPCRDWLLYTVTADGQVHPGCMVDAVEPCKCDDCELACHREFSDFVDPRLYPSHLWSFIRGPRA